MMFSALIIMQKGKLVPELIAPCGMNCGICVAFFGYTMKGEKRKHQCCNCRSRDRPCAFIKKECDKLATKQIEYCFECIDFPCANLKTLDNRYREKYGMSMIENLKYIQTKGIDQFLFKVEPADDLYTVTFSNTGSNDGLVYFRVEEVWTRPIAMTSPILFIAGLLALFLFAAGLAILIAVCLKKPLGPNS